MTARIKFVDKQNFVFKEIDVSLGCTDLAIFKRGTIHAIGGGPNSDLYDSLHFPTLYYVDNLIALPNLQRFYVGIVAWMGGVVEQITGGEETLKPLIEWPNVYELFQKVPNMSFPNYVLHDIVARDTILPMKTCHILSFLLVDLVRDYLIENLRLILERLCVSMNKLDLPDYVLLWIADFTPYMNTLISESEKIDLIRTIRGKKEDEKDKKD